MYSSPLLTLANTVPDIVTFRTVCFDHKVGMMVGMIKKKQRSFYNSIRLLESIIHLELRIYSMAGVHHLMLIIIKN